MFWGLRPRATHQHQGVRQAHSITHYACAPKKGRYEPTRRRRNPATPHNNKKHTMPEAPLKMQRSRHTPNSTRTIRHASACCRSTPAPNQLDIVFFGACGQASTREAACMLMRLAGIFPHGPPPEYHPCPPITNGLMIMRVCSAPTVGRGGGARTIESKE